jgi:hypothetical protein
MGKSTAGSSRAQFGRWYDHRGKTLRGILSLFGIGLA